MFEPHHMLILHRGASPHVDSSLSSFITCWSFLEEPHHMLILPWTASSHVNRSSRSLITCWSFLEEPHHMLILYYFTIRCFAKAFFYKIETHQWTRRHLSASTLLSICPPQLPSGFVRLNSPQHFESYLKWYRLSFICGFLINFCVNLLGFNFLLW